MATEFAEVRSNGSDKELLYMLGGAALVLFGSGGNVGSLVTAA
jgi:hypothetical protein